MLKLMNQQFINAGASNSFSKSTIANEFRLQICVSKNIDHCAANGCVLKPKKKNIGDRVNINIYIIVRILLSSVQS